MISRRIIAGSNSRILCSGYLFILLLVKPTVPASGEEKKKKKLSLYYDSKSSIDAFRILKISEVDLLQAISIPFDDPKHVYFAEGVHGFPAFGLRAGSDLRTPHSLLLPVTMFENFAIVASFKPSDGQGGFLFSVVTPSDSLISLGLSITAAPALAMQVGGHICHRKNNLLIFWRSPHCKILTPIV